VPNPLTSQLQFKEADLQIGSLDELALDELLEIVEGELQQIRN
jgi:hypothetical protein